MKGKALVPLAVGLVVGLFAIKYTMDTVKRAKGSTDTATVAVIVARQDIPSTSAIKPEMLAIMETPRTPLLPTDVYTKAEDLLGRVAMKSIPQGVPILPSMIAPEGTLPGLLVRVKEGYRAVAVKIDESAGVGYLVKPNDWVDVLAVMEVKKFGRTETVSKLILERVQVAAVGQVLNDTPEEEGAGANKHASTVTLLVKVDDVPKLHLAQTRGRITLAMRGNDDLTVRGTDETDDEGENTQEAKDGSQTGFGSVLTAMWGAAASQQASQPATQAPVEENHPVTVMVINSSASDKGQGDVRQIQFRDENSMETVESGATYRSSRRPQRFGPASRPAVTPTQNEDENGTDSFEPNEVTE